MPNNYWLEMELWKMRQGRINKRINFARIENPHPKLILRLMTKVGKVLENVGKYLQRVEQPSYPQTINSSNL